MKGKNHLYLYSRTGIVMLAISQRFGLCSNWNSNTKGFHTEVADEHNIMSQPLNIAVASHVVAAVVELQNNNEANALLLEERREQEVQVQLLLHLSIFREGF